MKSIAKTEYTHHPCPIDLAALWHAEDEMSRVTAPECEALFGEMKDYFALVEASSSHE